MTDQETTSPDGFPPGTVFEIASSAQRGLWLTQQADPASPAYLVAHAFRIDGPLDGNALAAAWSLLVNRHESLRTALVQRGERLYQAIEPLDGPVLRQECAVADIAAVLAVERNTPFDLSRPPLVRARLWPTGSDQHVLAVTFHHIAVDGVSVEILWRELEACYAALTEGRRPDLPEITLSYADFAAWEDEWMRGEEYQHQLNSLIERLRVMPSAIDLPVSGGSAGPHWRGGTHEFWIGEQDAAAVIRWATERNITPFTVLFGVYSGVLYRWTGQSDIVIGVPMSVRAQTGLENMVGMLVNTVAIPVHWGDDPTAREALDRCGVAVAEALAARQVPFDQVAAALPRLRAAGRAPIVQVSFGYEDDRGLVAGGMRLSGTKVQVLPGIPETAKFDLSLDCRLVGGRVQCMLEWSGQRMDADLVETFATHMRAAIRQAPSRPDDRVGDWDLGHAPVAATPAWLEDDSLTDETWTHWCSARRGRAPAVTIPPKD